MPTYDPDHVEYPITSGHVQIVTEDSSQLPAYWAYPLMGKTFPGVALVHDWWGITGVVRGLANMLAQTGYYVIVPDLFNGQIAHTPQQAMKLVEGLGESSGYPRVNSALGVLETHHRCNGSVGCVGIGMGGSLAFEAAITRKDLEAAVAFGGFPQRYFGKFHNATAPILAFYGAEEPHILPAAINKLKTELATSPLPHRVEVIQGVAHNFFGDDLTDAQEAKNRPVVKAMLQFLDQHVISKGRQKATNEPKGKKQKKK